MTLFVNGLTGLDVSLWCPSRGLIGASWSVDVELDGELGPDGMLFDFGEVKPWIKAHVDSGIDHTLLVPTQAPGLSVSECEEGLAIRTTWPYPMEVRGPRQSFSLLPFDAITTERLTQRLNKELLRRPPPRIETIRLGLREEAIVGSAYTYSHGLRQHAGNCQRIAHGHRSRLHIWQRNERAVTLEEHWAKQLNDRYLVHASDVVNDLSMRDEDMLTCRYRAPQGHFSLTLPKERCVVLPATTTIEHIADWLAHRVAQQTGEPARVMAFEGIDKGAVAEANP